MHFSSLEDAATRLQFRVTREIEKVHIHIKSIGCAIGIMCKDQQ